MAGWTFVQKATGTFDTKTVALTGVTAGNLILVFVKFEDGPNACTMSDGTTSFTMGTLYSGASGTNAQSGWLLSSVASGSVTYTVTQSGAFFFQAHVMEYSYTGTPSFDQQNGTRDIIGSTTVASGNITTTGTDELVFGTFSEYATATHSAEQINGVTFDQITPGAGTNGSALWSRKVASTFTGQTTCTLSAPDPWASSITAFKLAGGGIVGRVPRSRPFPYKPGSPPGRR